VYLKWEKFKLHLKKHRHFKVPEPRIGTCAIRTGHAKAMLVSNHDKSLSNHLQVRRGPFIGQDGWNSNLY